MKDNQIKKAFSDWHQSTDFNLSDMMDEAKEKIEEAPEEAKEAL